MVAIMRRQRIQSPLSPAEKRQVWGDFTDKEDEYLDEVEARWGQSQAYAQSARRVARYGKAEWEQINRDNATIEARIRDLMDAGVAPASPQGMDVAEAQRGHISHWFYAMDHALHAQKSDLYVPDPRFRAGLEKNTRAGAAEWLQIAIKANAARHSESGPGADQAQ